MQIKTTQVIVDPKVYPRFDINNEAVNSYMTAIGNLPPIVISADNRLIDGKHRLRAHQLSNIEDIEVEILDIIDDTEILKEAIKRNSTHGQQLAKEEKKNLARKLWESTTVVEIASLLSVSTGIVSSWTTDLEDTRKDEEKQKVIGLYLKCHTQTEIGKELGQSEGNISKILTKFKNEKMKDFNENTTKPPDSFQIYDIWNFSKLDQQFGQDYAGRIPGQIIENVLWYWTKPFDVVIDPMVGGGTTIDVCKSMYRRYQGCQ